MNRPREQTAKNDAVEDMKGVYLMELVKNVERVKNMTADELRAREEAAQSDAAMVQNATDINRVGEYKKTGRPKKSGVKRQFFGVIDLIHAGLSADKATRIIRACNRDLKAKGLNTLPGLAHKDQIAIYLPGIVLDDDPGRVSEQIAVYEQRRAKQSRATIIYRERHPDIAAERQRRYRARKKAEAEAKRAAAQLDD